MIRKIKNIVWDLLNIIGLGAYVQLMLLSELKDSGWFRSFKTKQSVDKDGNPLPWNAYPYIYFVEGRLKKHFDIFEYGSGNSTLWYAKRAGTVKSVENDKAWFELVSGRMPQNVKVVYQELEYNGEYSREVLKEDKRYHIIIIDGRDRVNCVKHSLNKLTEDGIIVFDNADLKDYTEGIELLKSSGFKRLDFFGMSPVTAHKNCTSIFYKQNNCLNI